MSIIFIYTVIVNHKCDRNMIEFYKYTKTFQSVKLILALEQSSYCYLGGEYEERFHPNFNFCYTFTVRL